MPATEAVPLAPVTVENAGSSRDVSGASGGRLGHAGVEPGGVVLVVEAWLRRHPWSVAALVAVSVGAVYLGEASPSVGGGNSGELQVMAHLLGIAHPPSYPLYLLLAKGASLLPLPGDVAWRINALTALLAAVAVFLAGLLPLALRRGPVTAQVLLASAIAGVATGAMPRLWSLAVEAEVFSLHLALVAGFWLALARWDAPPAGAADRWLYVAAGLAGLGLANHRTFVFIALAGALFVAIRRPRTLLRGRLVVACAALAGLGLTPYLYVLRGLVVPVPFFAPGDVQRLSRSDVWYVLQGNASQETGGGGVVWQLFADRALLDQRTRWLAGHLAAQLGALGTPLAALAAAGIIAIARGSPRWTGMALLGSLGAAVFAMSYAKYPDADRYLLPLQMLLALGVAVAISAAVGQAARYVERGARAAAAGGIVGLVLAGYWALSLATLAAGTSHTRGGYVHHTLFNLEGVERDAVVCTWWASAWPWWYAQYVDGHRPDVAVVPKGPDDCVRDVLPQEFGRRGVYVPALTDRVRQAEFTFFPSRDLWLAVARRGPLAEGSLLKGPDDRIYFYDGAHRRWIPSLDVFAGHGFSWDAVQITPEYVLREIPEGAPLAAP